MSTENNPDKIYKDSIRILTDLIAFKTISGNDNNSLINYCDDILKNLGATSFRIFDGDKKRVNLFASLKSKNGKIDLNYGADKSTFPLSFEDITNVFINILENSIKYSTNKPEISVKTYNLDNKLYINFKDNGMGISKKVKSKIFDKFFRVSKGNIHNVKGHGLGLSFVKKIIDLHNGTISVNSELGKGSQFIISFNLK